MFLLFVFCANAQKVEGKLTINGKSNSSLTLETNSAVQLFKEFKLQEYKLGFSFDANRVTPNIYNETVVYFEFITQVRKDGKLIKEVKRAQPFPYFPGDMYLAPESFDFIPILASIDAEGELAGTLPQGKYNITLAVKPINAEGAIQKVGFDFVLRRRPTR